MIIFAHIYQCFRCRMNVWSRNLKADKQMDQGSETIPVGADAIIGITKTCAKG